MQDIGSAILEVQKDPDFEPAIKAALQEVRENIARTNRDDAMKSAAQMYHAITILRPEICTAMLCLILFRLAEEEVISAHEKGVSPPPPPPPAG